MPAYTKIKCEICGQEVSKSNMSKHLRRHEKHPESFEIPKYRVNHEGLECQFCGKECKNSNSLRNHERLCKLNPDRQNKKIVPIQGFNNKGKTAWNKGLTKETDERIAKYAQNISSKIASGIVIGCVGLKGDENYASHEDVRKKISKKQRENYKDKQPICKGRSKHGRYKNIWCDSTWELAFVIYCLDHNIDFERNKKGFQYLWENDYHTYYPDFYIKDKDLFVEIKGYYGKKAQEKYNQFPGNLIVLQKDSMKDIFDYVYEKYGKDIYQLYDK